MDEEIKELPFLRYVGMMTTLKCQVACPHCVVQASPARTEVLAPEEAADWIRQLGEYRGGWTRALGLTGGEPFFDLGQLKAVSEAAQAAGMVVSAVTNAFWATTPEEAFRVLDALPAVKSLGISTDAYHLRFIPMERVQNAVLAAEGLGRPWTLAVCTQSEDDPEFLGVMAQLLTFASRDRINVTTAFPVGRAFSELARERYHLEEVPPPHACTRGGAPILFPDGRVLACIGPIVDLPPGHPLELGNLRRESLQVIFDRAEGNVLLHALRMWGPSRLLALLRERGHGDGLPERYLKDCLCDACYGLFRNPATVADLRELAEDSRLAFEVACARVHYMGESEMLSALGVTASLA